MRSQILDQILDAGAVAVVRLTDASKGVQVAQALAEGGITAIEITMTVPNALVLIAELARTLPTGIVLGVGSVLDLETARRAVGVGARFVVSPVSNPEILEAASTLDVPVMPGAFTPTEIQRALSAGAEVVKLFPADVLGPSFLRSVLAPMPRLRIVPTGGVDASNAASWIQAGACAVGVGGALVDKRAIAEGRFDVLTRNARELVEVIRAARSETP